MKKFKVIFAALAVVGMVAVLGMQSNIFACPSSNNNDGMCDTNTGWCYVLYGGGASAADCDAAKTQEQQQQQ